MLASSHWLITFFRDSDGAGGANATGGQRLHAGGQRAAKSLVAIAKKSKSPILRFASDKSQEPLQSLEGRESRMQEL